MLRLFCNIFDFYQIFALYFGAIFILYYIFASQSIIIHRKTACSNKTNNPNGSPSKRMFGLFSYGASGDTGSHHRVINKKAAVTTPDNWEPALPMVGVTGLEPAAFCSQSRRATSCATPRCIYFSIFL